VSDIAERSIIGAAHAYRQRGWRVIQVHSVGPDGLTCSCNRGRNCKSAGKHPIIDAWQDTPVMSGPDIEEAWTGYRRHANIGIATGAPSGFWVLDIDPDKGGLDSLKALIAEHGAPPETYTVRTGGKGWQFYFTLPDFDVRNSADVKGHTGIDVRGTGGQVVAPPSVSGKGAYTVSKDVPLAAAPDWLLEIVRKAEPTGPTTYSADLPDRSDLPEAEQRRLDSYAARAVEGNLARLDELKVGMGPDYKGPAWNHTTFEVSCGLVEIANSPWAAYSMQQAYDDVFTRAPRDAGFDDDTVNKTFESARTKVGEKARPVPVKPADREPDFMDAPGIPHDPRLQDPHAASGANAQPAGQPGAQGGTSSLRPHDFIDPREGLLTGALAVAVEDMGPLAIGVDGAFWSYQDGVWSEDPKVVRARVTKRLGNLFRGSHASNVEEFISYRVPRIIGEPVEQWINFQNGLLDWRTGVLHPHTPEVMSTIQLPVAWDPEGATCPRFEQFLEESFSQDYIDLAWEVMGYAMYSGNPLQVAMMFIGNGQNGKSTLIHVIEDMLGGRRNVSSETLARLSSNTFAAAGLFGKIANIAGDIDATYQESTALFKSISASDTISAEHKYRDAFEFKPWAVNIFSANKIPGSADVSEGYLRRWIVLQFPNKPKNPDPDLRRKLAAELPGIAAKAVPALRRVLERRAFDIKGDAAHGKEEFAEAIDQVRQWLSDATVEAPDHRENRTNLYRAYCQWANANGAGQLKSGEFYHRLESIGFRAAKYQGQRCFTGIMVANLAEQQRALRADESNTDTFFEGVN
jgi:P4 family phage/plasmid primase-like protien